MTTQIGHWIDGRRTPGTSGRTAAVFNPATGEHTGDVALASADEVGAAVSSAVAAARSWRSASLSRRAAVLFAFRELLHAHADELAAQVTAEHGKVFSDAQGEIARGLENVEFACGVPQLLKGGFSEQAATGVDVYSIRQP
ncbi:MAG: aldehyde dehydrogenase family protein, partial [Catenulispora sp.]